MNGGRVLLLLLVFAGACGSVTRCRADSAPKAREEGMKCGQDCALQVLRDLGVDRPFDEIDARLQHKPVVSLAELSRLFRDYQLHVSAAWIPGSQVETISQVLDEAGTARAMIARLPGVNDGPGHFVVVQAGRGDTVSVFDVSRGERHDLDFAQGPLQGIEVLLIGADQAVATALVPSTARRIQRTLGTLAASPSIALLLYGALAAVAFGSLFQQWRGRSGRTRGSENLVVEPGLQPAPRVRRLPWRVMTGALICAVLAVSAAWIVQRELDPLATDARLVEAGRLPVGTSQDVVFPVHNRSLWRTVEIQEVRGSCACLSPSIENTTIPPLGHTTINVALTVTNTGPSAQRLLVDPKGDLNALYVDIAYDGYDAAKVIPSNVNIGFYPSGMAFARKITVAISGDGGAPAKFRIHPSSHLPEGMKAVLSPEAQVGDDIGIQLDSAPSSWVGPFSAKLILEDMARTDRRFVVSLHGEKVPPVRLSRHLLIMEDEAAAGRADINELSIESPFGPIVAEAVEATYHRVSDHSRGKEGEESRLIYRVDPGEKKRGDVLRIRLSKPVAEDLSIPIVYVEA